MNIPDDYFDGQMSALDSSRTLFVGDLSFFCNEEDLFALFAPFGSILTVRVRRGITGESLMHGFIAMELPEAAKTAIGSIDGMEFMGRNIRVQLSSDGQRSAISKDSLVQVHVSFISKQNNFLITEKILRDLFSPFGAVADVAIKKHTAVPKQGRQSGYGFVYFFEPTGAYRAVQALKQNTVHDITLDCSISHKSETMIRQGQHNGGNGGASHNSSFSAQRYDRAQGLIPYPTNNSSASISPRSISPRSTSPRSVSPRAISPRLMSQEHNSLGSNLSTKSYEELYSMNNNNNNAHNSLLYQYDQRPGAPLLSQLPTPPHQQMPFPNMKPPSPAQPLGSTYPYQQTLQQSQGYFAQQQSNSSLNDLTGDMSRFGLQSHSPNGAPKHSMSTAQHVHMNSNGMSAGGIRTPPGPVQQQQTRYSGYMDYAMQQPAHQQQQHQQSLTAPFRGGFDDMSQFQQPMSQLSQSQLPSMHGSPRQGYSQTGFNPGSTDILSAATASLMHSTNGNNGNSSLAPSPAGTVPTVTAFTELDSSNYGDFLQEMRLQKLKMQQQQQQQLQAQQGNQFGYLQQLSRSSDVGSESSTGNHVHSSHPTSNAGLVLFPSVSTSPRASSPRQLDADGAFSSTQSTDSLLAALQTSHQPLSQSNLFAHNNINNNNDHSNSSAARKISSSVQQFLLQDDERVSALQEAQNEDTEGDMLGAQTLRYVLEK